MHSTPFVSLAREYKWQSALCRGFESTGSPWPEPCALVVRWLAAGLQTRPRGIYLSTASVENRAWVRQCITVLECSRLAKLQMPDHKERCQTQRNHLIMDHFRVPGDFGKVLTCWTHSVRKCASSAKGFQLKPDLGVCGLDPDSRYTRPSGAPLSRHAPRWHCSGRRPW
ncbi:hypothetical protein NDU88_000683 [Pleurodeles waltl]|uniref:Uncharacterized protein n=1 Tax=Pleurodeles waltl TaxID=8319 RepID=A0AAV7WIT1_PLEWA|nr:hypothetical protein NDU88_000683 [Pleurodeles waltl]